jgi:hypothetical protein
MGPGKKFCCVTTRRRRSWILSGLGRGFGTLAARTLGLGVAGFGSGSLAMSGLPLRCEPAPDLALTFGVLAVALIPALRPVLAAAPFAQADPRAWSPPSGGRTVLGFIVKGAQGRLVSQGKARGECVSVLPERYPRRERVACLPV